jgi:HD-GYP domain-containing protein (c-di-GMP phosphodiesterase class II)
MDSIAPASGAASAAGGRDSGLRLAELIAAFSLALDLGLGQPMEHVLRSWLIANRLGDRLGLDADQRAAVYYVITLAWVGCVADTPTLAAIFGDDIAYRGDGYELDQTGRPLLMHMLRHAGAGGPALRRLRIGVDLIRTGGRAVGDIIRSHCLVTARMAERIGLGSDVADPLQHVFTRWDGKGLPQEVAGEGIALATRLFHLADVIEVFHRRGGVEAATGVARERSGTLFDPALVEAFCAAAADVLPELDVEPDWNSLIAVEPALQRRLDEHEVDTALEAIADFTDLRSPSRAGHSRGVANLAAGAAKAAGVPDADVKTVWRAGLVHDLGLHGIPATILEKSGPLSSSERERMRMSAYYTERMLARPPILARIGAIAALAHERSDGSGYHRGLTGPAIPLSGRVLAVACAYQAMTEPRPYRPALTAAQAAGQLRADVRTGRFDADAVDAVLKAAGHRVGKRWSGPAGLTPREVEVLVLIARGASNRQAATVLNITEKTVGTFVERIYTKTGASTRSTATLFAMQHGLLGTLEPLDL